MRRFILFVCMLLAALAPLTPESLRAQSDGARKQSETWQWYSLENGQVRLHLYLFWSEGCPHCMDAGTFLGQLHRRYSWLRVHGYETSRNRGNLQLYQRMAESLSQRAGQVPAFFFCKQMVLGYESYEQTGRRIETNLVHCYNYLVKQQHASLEPGRPPEARRHVASIPNIMKPAVHVAQLTGAVPLVAIAATSSPNDSAKPMASPDGEAKQLELPPPLPEQKETVTLPGWGTVPVSEFSLPILTVSLAVCDAFNPCAFFVLLSLLSLLIHTNSRPRMLLIGGCFVLFSGLFYFVFMAAWLNVFLVAGHLQAITVVAGVIAVFMALINIKDYFAFKRGVSLSIPESAKPGLFDRLRRLVGATRLAPMLLGTLALAAAANSYELLCTAGFPMVFTRALTLHELPTSTYYGYLVLYNTIYVLPLAAIVGVFVITLGSRKLQEREGRILKLLSGNMMLLLGALLLLAPDLLHRALAAVFALLAAVLLTAIIVGLDRLRTGLQSRKPSA